MTLVEDIVVKRLGRVAYEPTWEAMRAFTRARDDFSADELWLLEHSPVYTVGQGAVMPPLANAIPVVKSDRGGDITYHGPGQVVLYTLVDLARRSIKVKRFVWVLEQAVIDLVGHCAKRRPGAPGVYVDGAKIAALGIRVVRGHDSHDPPLKAHTDLSPLFAIAPCVYPGLRVTQMRDLGFTDTPQALAERLSRILVETLDA